MRHPILDTIPGTGEASAFYIDQEIEQLSRNLSIEKKKANVVRDMNLIRDLEDVGRSVALRATAPAEASRASSPRIHRGDPQRTRR